MEYATLKVLKVFVPIFINADHLKCHPLALLHVRGELLSIQKKAHPVWRLLASVTL